MPTLRWLALAALVALAGCAASPSPAAPTVGPAATASAQPADAAVVEDLGVRFAYAPGLAESVLAEAVPASAPAGDQTPYWAIYPEHRRFTLNGYPVQGSPIAPALAVFPAGDYAAAIPEAQQALDELEALLAGRPADPAGIPVLPLQNAAQILRAQVRYLPFEGGSGVRFLTYYAQDAAPLANPGLLYIFQGLTDDGRHLVSVTLPVSTPALDELAAAFPAGGAPAAYQAYIAGAAERLAALGPGDFTPGLDQLDALVGSISVE